MQFMVLIHQKESLQQTRSQEEWTKVYVEFAAVTKALKDEGHLLEIFSMQPLAAGKTVRSRGGTLGLADGPAFATEDQLSSVYLVEAKDLDEAARLAGRIPAARWGCVEVRPRMVYKGTPEKTYQKP
jgi:hypothetical protein